MTIDFKSLECLVTAGVAGGFEDGGGAVFETGEEGAGVVDGDGVPLAGFLVNAFLDEGFGHGGDADNVAIDPAGAVDVVGEKVAGDAGAGCRCVKTPEGFAALGEFLGHGPVLEEVGAVVIDAPEVTTVYDLLGEGDSGEEAVIVPNEIGESGGFDGFDHLEALFAVEGEGLLAKDHLAVLNRGHRDVVVGVVGRADVDGVDIVAFDQLSPIGLGIGVAPLFSEGLHLVLGAAADDLLDGNVVGFEKVLKLGVGIRMGAPHESVANDANADRFFAHLCDRLEKGTAGARQKRSILP